MKKITVFILSVLLFATACKENSDSPKKGKNNDTTAQSNSPEAEAALKVYRRAFQRGDFYTAIAYLNEFLIYDSSKIEYKDTLLNLYYETNQPLALFKVSEEILKVKPNDTGILVLNVETAAQIGAVHLVTDNIKKLLSFDPSNLGLKYQYAVSMLSADSFARGITLLNEIIVDSKAKTQKIPYVTVDRTGKQKQIELSIYMASLMNLGKAYVSTNNLAKAEDYFRKAWNLNRNFDEASSAILEIQRLQGK